MPALAPQPRHALLPDLERSRAVLVACDDDAVRVPEFQPAARTAQLAEALASARTGMAFHPGSVAVVTSWQHPAEVFDAVRRAAEEASDVLLFHYAGSGLRHREFALTRTVPGSDNSIPLRAVADIVRDSPAARQVVLLDCEHFEDASSYFTRDPVPDGSSTPHTLSLLGKQPSMYFASGDDRIPAGDEFTDTLAEALRSGVEDGPEALDLVALRNAIEGRWAQLRYYVENEYIGAPDTLNLVGGRDVALGVNVAFGPDGDRGRRPFYLDAGVVDLMERWWD
ncbi:hypothetical protein OOK41_15045 [Micromonospora sp. NBC_01655]|uniref:hypothetical protein n=1 Tax=Micromonospora sp. NBC_01655 TaxID=2975983 RepID=UPI0022511588|nr:hypothetical protein [Micromonospora sp. NBC_01655]MCX4471602.1 hypothetical protein [Micromonospora sp. NBC_01655]